MRRVKLFSLTRSTFKIPSHVGGDDVCFLGADSIPVFLWPDGKWCFDANAYMLELFESGKSRKIRGGTLSTYASNISPLIRFCFDNGIQLHELSDNEFTLFIKALKEQRRLGQPDVRVRKADAVIAIGRACLGFLSFIGELRQFPNMIGPEGQICATRRQATFSGKASSRTNGVVTVMYWHHRSFPTPDPQVKRLPISTTAITQIRNSIHKASSSIFIRKRRYVMIKILEITGGRRSEVAALKVSSIYEAASMVEPMLKILTVKRRGDAVSYRLIPIARHDITFLIEFIEKNRKRVIRCTCGHQNDDDYLLVSETTGHGLAPNTITQELAILSKAANIRGQSCPHMFRHRFITKIFVALIIQHELENPDDFRRALMDVEAFKHKVQQFTGQTKISSIDRYINLAFEEVANFSKTYSVVIAHQFIESFRSSLQQYQSELRNGDNAIDISTKLMSLVEGLDTDLCRLREAID